jgi:hypothetical protein
MGDRGERLRGQVDPATITGGGVGGAVMRGTIPPYGMEWVPSPGTWCWWWSAGCCMGELRSRDVRLNQELANLSRNTIPEVVEAAWQGIGRGRREPTSLFSFLRHCGLKLQEMHLNLLSETL